MLTLSRPGLPDLDLHHLVLDFNGTLALRGLLIEGVATRCAHLAEQLQLHCVTGDTFGTARLALAGLPIHLHVLPSEGQSHAKRDYLRQLEGGVCAIGNGWNDRLILEEADLAFAVLMQEGAASATLRAADAVFTSILDALDTLLDPTRLVALLRD